MSFPTGLFVDTPEMQEVSLHSLGEDHEKWPEELVQKFKERIPDAGSMSVLVKFMKQDEENGAATGSLLISNSKKQAIVPVIVKDFMLYPLDVFIVDSKLLPLTPDYFRAAFMDNNVFQKLEEYPAYGGLGRFEDSNLWNATYPPSLGRYAYASAGYPVLDAISETINPSEFKQELLADTASAARFYKNGHADIIKKLASIKPLAHSDFKKSAESLIPREVGMLRKHADVYEELANGTTVFSPVKSHFGKEQVMGKRDVSTGSLNEVERNGEVLFKMPGPRENQIFMNADSYDAPTTAKLASESGLYTVLDKNGKEVDGTVVTTVIDFDMNKVAMKLFLGKDSTLQTEIAGIKKEGAVKIAGSKLGGNQTGCFVYQSEKGPVATIPVHIKTAVQKDGEIFVKANDLSGNRMSIKLSSLKLDRIAKLADVYCLPVDKFQWVPMNGFSEVSSSPLAFITKTSGALPANKVTLVHSGHGQYWMRGVEKYANACEWNQQNLERYQVKFLLASLGATADQVKEAMDKAANAERVVIRGLNQPPLAAEKIAAAMPKAREMMKVALSLKSNLIKAASYVENSQTVDTLLSLNFVNPDNISKFVGKLPAMKSAISNLASLLIASRLGMKEIPEQATASAMTRLIDVVNGLEALRATQEGGK